MRTIWALAEEFLKSIHQNKIILYGRPIEVIEKTR
jgi:hypothetical protein